MSRVHGVGEPRMCSGCVRGIDDVDDLPIVKRGAVTVAGALLTVRDAARAALEVRAPDGQLRCLHERVAILRPFDDAPTAECDTWARTGFVMGAVDGWLGKVRTDREMPPDLPVGLPRIAFFGCYNKAMMVVLTVKAEDR